MKRWSVLPVIGLLAGCAQQPVTPQLGTPTPPATPTQADARTRAEIHTQLGAAYYEVGNLSVALESLNEALKADPNYGPAFNMLGLVYMDLKEDALAQQSFQRALAISPADSDTNNNYGWFLCQRKRHEEGIRYFMEAVKNPLYQNSDKSFVNAGVCARDRGDDNGAIEFFERALRLQPLHPQALYHMADISFRRGAFSQARAYLSRLTRSGISPSAEVLWLALRVERQLGDREAEASYGLQLRRNFPNSREAQALLNRQFE